MQELLIGFLFLLFSTNELLEQLCALLLTKMSSVLTNMPLKCSGLIKFKVFFLTLFCLFPDTVVTNVRCVISNLTCLGRYSRSQKDATECARDLVGCVLLEFVIQDDKQLNPVVSI